MGAKHWHVLTGLRGLFMPDDNQVFANQQEAREYAAEEARRLNDEAAGERDAQGRFKPLPAQKINDDYYLIEGNSCIEVTDCSETTCIGAEDK